MRIKRKKKKKKNIKKEKDKSLSSETSSKDEIGNNINDNNKLNIKELMNQKIEKEIPEYKVKK